MRKARKDAQEVADDWFFENTIRPHRAGEGAAYTGMKPAGPSEGPVNRQQRTPLRPKTLGNRSDLSLRLLKTKTTHRFHHVMAKKKNDVNDVAAGREYYRGIYRRGRLFPSSMTVGDNCCRAWREAWGESRVRSPTYT